MDALAAQHTRELDALVRRLTGVRNDLLAAQQEELEVFSRRLQARRPPVPCLPCLALARRPASLPCPPRTPRHPAPPKPPHPNPRPRPPPAQAAKLALERSQASRRLVAEQAIRAALGLARPKSPVSPGEGGAGRLQAGAAAEGGSSRLSPYSGGSSPKASPKSPSGRGGDSPGRPPGRAGGGGAGSLKASIAGLALQPGGGPRRPGSPGLAGGGGSSVRRGGLDLVGGA